MILVTGGVSSNSRRLMLYDGHCRRRMLRNNDALRIYYSLVMRTFSQPENWSLAQRYGSKDIFDALLRVVETLSRRSSGLKGNDEERHCSVGSGGESDVDRDEDLRTGLVSAAVVQ